MLLSRQAPNRAVLFTWKDTYIYKKTWSRTCRSLHVLRLWNCPICRNEQRRKPHDVNIAKTAEQFPKADAKRMSCMQRICTPVGRPRCFVFDRYFEFSRFQHVKIKAYSYAFLVYVPTLAFPHCRDFRQELGSAKVEINLKTSNN